MRALSQGVLCVVLCFSFVVNGAYVTTLGFKNITANDAVNAAAGEAGLFLDVYSQSGSAGVEQVRFVFRNESSAGGVIRRIYFEDDSLLAGAQIVDSPLAVDFEEGFGSNNLPGGNSIVPKFETTRSFLALSPAPKRGVGVSEQVGIIFDLQTSQDINDILSDLETKEFRVGLHVISFINGKSESFINDIPEPITVALLGLGGLLIRRKK